MMAAKPSKELKRLGLVLEGGHFMLEWILWNQERAQQQRIGGIGKWKMGMGDATGGRRIKSFFGKWEEKVEEK
jgi:hypothetical protein